MSTAKHRFASSSKPLAYLVLNFESAVVQDVRIKVERPSSAEAAHAKDMMQCDMERWVTLAMLAHEAMVLTNTLDNEKQSACDVHDELAHFVNRCRALS